MVPFLRSLFDILIAFAGPRAQLVAENLLLRQRVIILQRRDARPRFRAFDRWLIGELAGMFRGLLDAILVVKPETVIRWHRAGWRRALIVRMWRGNLTWGEDRIAGELAKLGYRVSPRTVARYRPSGLSRGRGQRWMTFVRNHLDQTCTSSSGTPATPNEFSVATPTTTWAVPIAACGCSHRTALDIFRLPVHRQGPASGQRRSWVASIIGTVSRPRRRSTSVPRDVGWVFCGAQGVDPSVIALWLGHESVETTHVYVEADLATKERALAKLAPAGRPARRFRADDKLMTFLAAL